MSNTTTLDGFAPTEVINKYDCGTQNGYMRRKKFNKERYNARNRELNALKRAKNMQPSAIESLRKQLLRPVVMEAQQENQ